MDNIIRYDKCNMLNNNDIAMHRGGVRRNSNLEILRIISMCLVMMLHYIPTRLTPSAASLQTDFWETLLNLELRSLSFVAVNCFVLISGYFGIKWKIKSFSSLIFRILFWSAISYVLAVVLTPLILGETYVYSGNLFANIFTIRWFIGAYLCLYVFSPVLNSFLDNVSQSKLGCFLLAFYALSTIFGWILKSHEFYEGMSMLALAGLYLIGGYIRRYELKVLQFNRFWDLAIYLIIGIVLVIMSIIAYRFNATQSLYGYLNPLVIIQSVYLFLFFKKLDVGKSGFINLIAASAFSVYLFHTDICSRVLWSHICEVINSYGPVLSVFIVILFFCSLFLICVLFDQVGTLVFDGMIKFRKTYLNIARK